MRIRSTRAAVRLLAVVASVGLPPLSVNAGPLSNTFTGYSHEGWTIGQGLPPGRIRAIAQGARGYLWLGTDHGLFRFDGIRFVFRPTRHPSPSAQDRVVTMSSTSDGAIWLGFGGDGGLARVTDERVQTYGTAEGIDGGAIMAITEDHEGTLWVGGIGGLFRKQGERWQRVGQESGIATGAVYAIYHDSHDRIWITAALGVFQYISTTRTFVQVDASSHSSRVSVAEHPSGTVVATEQSGAVRLLEGGWPFDLRALQPRLGQVERLLFDTNGQLWIGTEGRGLWKLAGTKSQPSIEQLTARSGLSSDVVTALFEDHEQNVWVGTYSGLHKFSRQTALPVVDLEVPASVAVAPDASIWIGTRAGVARYAPSGEREPSPPGLPQSMVYALHFDRSGTLWAATNEQLYVLRHNAFQRVEMRRTPRLGRIVAIGAGSDGVIWFADLAQGLFRLADGVLSPVDIGPTNYPSAYSVLVDRANRVWVGFGQGHVGVVHPNGRHEIYGPDSGMAKGLVHSIYEDGSGTIWFGASEGVARFRDGRITTVAYRETFPIDTVTGMTEDDSGHLWLAVSAGLMRVKLDAFNDQFDHKSSSIGYTLYNTVDGLAGLPIKVGAPSLARGRDGRLWFLTGSGLTILDSGIVGETPPPPVIIEELVADDTTFIPGPDLRLLPRTSRIEINYTAVTFRSPSTLNFRYRLEGFDHQWVDAGKRRQAFYTNLPPGHYRFVVTAANPGDNVEPETAVLAFQIAPAFVQTPIFYALCVVGAVSAAYGLWRYRLTRVRRQFSLVLAERIRLSREIHDTLLQGLVGVAMHLDAAASACSAPAKGNLRHARRQIEDYLREARQTIWNLRLDMPQTSDFPIALRTTVLRILGDGPPDFTFAVTGAERPLPSPVQSQLLRISQEAAANAIRHAAATAVNVTVDYAPDGIVLTVTDNGRGFDQGLPFDNSGEHFGLLMMHERAQQVGGRLSIHTERGAGTSVTASVPLQPLASTASSLRWPKSFVSSALTTMRSFVRVFPH